MMIPEKLFTEEKFERMFAAYTESLYGKRLESELARPGPKSTAQTPAPPSERIKGSKENKPGSAATKSTGGKIDFVVGGCCVGDCFGILPPGLLGV